MKGLFAALSGFEVKNLQETDWEIFRDLMLEAMQTNPDVMGSKAEIEEFRSKRERDWKDLIKPPNATIVAFQEGKPVGCLSVKKPLGLTREINGETHNVCFIENLFISSNCRGDTGCFISMTRHARTHIQNDVRPSLVVGVVMPGNSLMLRALQGSPFSSNKHLEHTKDLFENGASVFSHVVPAKPDAETIAKAKAEAEATRIAKTLADASPVLPPVTPTHDVNDPKRIVMAPPKPRTGIPGIVIPSLGRRR